MKRMVLSSGIGMFLIGWITLLPGMLGAGSLEPTAPPGPTMKTLDEIPPSWSQRLDSTNGSTSSLYLGCDSSRFECIMFEGSSPPLPKAVLDKETGLVWERSPSSSVYDWQTTYFNCLHKTVGGRKGWRLPSIEELYSLEDNDTTDLLPDGHPFINIQSRQYWSSTTVPGIPDEAMVVLFGGGPLPGGPKDKTDTDACGWCVRGGKGNDGY